MLMNIVKRRRIDKTIDVVLSDDQCTDQSDGDALLIANSPTNDQNNDNDSQSTVWHEEWLKHGDYTMTLFDKEVIVRPNEWLTDTIMNVAQHLLQKQFPGVKGLQNVLLNELNAFDAIDNNEGFVQIVNDSHNHWLVVSNIRCADRRHECRVYDSKTGNYKLYGDEIKNAVTRLMKSEDSIRLDVPFCTQQDDNSQCGVYAIAFAEALCAGRDPSEILFSNSPQLMRNHLLVCLINGKITQFPTGADTIVQKFVIERAANPITSSSSSLSSSSCPTSPVLSSSPSISSQLASDEPQDIQAMDVKN